MHVVIGRDELAEAGSLPGWHSDSYWVTANHGHGEEALAKLG